MSEQAGVATQDVLSDLGFRPVADPMPGLLFEFGNFTLRAACLTNLHFARVVSFSKVLTTPRTVAQIDFEMPSEVSSRELCAAWISWHLDQAADGRTFKSAREVGWLAEGRWNQHLLPWVIEATERKQREAALRARSYCTMEREWLKLALKTLAEHLENADDGTAVVFSFDGSVLRIRCSEKVIAATAQGDPWTREYALAAKQLRNLPKRLRGSVLAVSVWESKLYIGDSVYTGVSEFPSTQTKSL